VDYFLSQISSLVRFAVVLAWQSERSEWTAASHQRREGGNPQSCHQHWGL